MCRPATCNVCGKTTWAGCGDHIDEVKATVPSAQWCDGTHTDAEEQAAKQKADKEQAAKEQAGKEKAGKASGGGFFASLFGR